MTEPSYQDQLNRLSRAISKASGQHFTLISVICNYEKLQQDILSNLRKHCPVKVIELELTPEKKNLFKAIKSKLEEWREEQPYALMILGLEHVHDLERLLASAKGERDRFREHFHFPLVLWMTDEVRKKLANVATDFYNWTGIPISFNLTNEQLIELIKEETTGQFNKIINQEINIFFTHKNLEQEHSRHRRELELVQRELQKRGIEEPELEANLYFAIGKDYYITDQIEEAIQNYKKSLKIWRKQTDSSEPQGVILFCLSLCYRRLAERKRAWNKYYWTWERAYLKKCLTVFEQSKREDLVAKFITELGEVLLRLKKWDDLQTIALKSQKLHENSNICLQLAQDYGFQAQVALKKEEEIQQIEHKQELIKKAQHLAKKAWKICEKVGDEQQQSNLSWYLLLLAEAQQKLNQTLLAIANLEKAKTISKPKNNPQLHIEILNKLRSLYYEQKQYLKAFEIKQERQIVESQFGFRAFIGAASLKPQNPIIPEGQETVASAIAVSGRQNYVDRLISRFYLHDTKLTVIHGPSGVGKSSTIKAGLIPILKHKVIQDCDVLPLLIRLSDNWVREIGQILTHTHLKSLSHHPKRFSESRNSPKVLEADLKSLIGLIDSAKIEIKTLQEHFEKLSKSLEDKAVTKKLLACSKRIFESPPLSQRQLESLKKHREILFSHLELQKAKEWELYSECLDALIKKEEEIKTRQKSLKYHSDLLDSKAAEELKICLERIDEPLNSIDAIILQLRNNKNWNWLTVLIFDQFEEFFFTCTKAEEQNKFWDFLNDCLETDLVYIVLSLREDYLHYLLKWEPFIKNGTNWQDILSSRNRLPLRNFDENAAKNIIIILTEQSQFYIEEKLVNRLVNNLANNSGYIRPIELQIVGYQLQENSITTLEEYKNLGNTKYKSSSDSSLTNQDNSKAILVQEYLKEVVEDCGVENKQAADLILYLLTDENYNRPLKTRKEIVRELQSLKEVEEQKLNLVLKIFVKSGLVLLWSQIPDDRYQLVHDYLVSLIRGKKRPTEYQELVEKLAKEKEKSNQALRAKEIAEAREEATQELNNQLKNAISERENIQGTLTEVRKKIRKARHFGFVSIAVLIGIAVTLVISSLKFQRYLDITKMEIGSQEILDTLNSGNIEEPFLKAMVLGNKLKKMDMENRGAKGVRHYPAIMPIFALQQALDAVQKQEKRFLNEKNYEVIAASFTPDGQVAAVLDGGYIIIWNPQTSEKPTMVPVLRDIFQYSRIIKFSEDGQKILIILTDGTAIIRDTKGKELANLKTNEKDISDASFSPDGKFLATSSSFDGVTRIWSFQDNKQAKCEDPKAEEKQVLGVSFSATGKELATVSGDGLIRIWDWQCKLITRFRADDELSESDDAIQSVSFSPNKVHLAVGLRNGAVVLWNIKDIKTPEKIKKISIHDGSVLNLKFSHDGKRLATATNETNDTTIRLWDNQGNQLDQFKGHKNSIWDVDFNQDGTLLATASADGTIQLWTLEPKNGQTVIKTQLESILDVHFINNEQRYLKLLSIASNQEANDIKISIKTYKSDDSGQYIFDSSVNTQSVSLKGVNNKRIRGVFSPNGDLIATTIEGANVHLWNLQGELIKIVKGHQDIVNDVSFSPDGKLLATASTDKTVRLWDLQGEELAKCQGHNERVLRVSFSLDGKWLASASADKTAIVWEWDSQDGSCQKKKFVSQKQQYQEEKEVLFVHQDVLFGVSFSPDGKLLATVSKDNKGKLWNLQKQGKEEATFKGHKDWVRDIRFSPDGKILVTASRDKTIGIWNLEGERLAQFTGHSLLIDRIKFTPDDSQLVSISDDNTVRLWQIESHDNFLKNLLEQGCTELKKKTYLGNLFKNNSNFHEDYQKVENDCNKVIKK